MVPAQCAPQETRASAEQPAWTPRRQNNPLSATCLQIQCGLPSQRALSTRGTRRARLRGAHRPLTGGAVRVLRETRVPLIAGNLARLSSPRSCGAAQKRHSRLPAWSACPTRKQVKLPEESLLSASCFVATGPPASSDEACVSLARWMCISRIKGTRWTPSSPPYRADLQSLSSAGSIRLPST